MCFGFFALGPMELFIILLIVLVLFGAKKLPEIGRSFGEMLSGLRGGLKDSDDKSDSQEPSADKDKKS
jgi:sec-independent protein translocase protein TatA